MIMSAFVCRASVDMPRASFAHPALYTLQLSTPQEIKMRAERVPRIKIEPNILKSKILKIDPPIKSREDLLFLNAKLDRLLLRGAELLYTATIFPTVI